MPFPPLQHRIPKTANKPVGECIQLTNKETIYREVKKVNKQKQKNNVKNVRKKTLSIKETSLNILSTNARDMKYKEEDLKNKINHLGSSIFAVQETHYTRKGKFKLKDFQIFESIRKNKDHGGSMLGIHVGLQPVLVSEYSEQFELIVVEIEIADLNIRVITGYGPQETWDENERVPFYTALEKEIVCAELEGRQVIIAIDANAKFGTKYIPNDPKEMSRNGKILADIIERHALFVVNGSPDKTTGLITREMSTVNGVEKSVIDFVIMSSSLVKHIKSMHIDDQRIHVLTKNQKTKSGTNISKSDHNIIETKMNLTWNSTDAEILEVYKYKDTESQKTFKDMTTNTKELSNIIELNKPLDVVAKKFVKRLKGFISKSFKKVRIVDRTDKTLENLYAKRRLLRTKTDAESVQELQVVENKLCETYSESMFKKIMGEIKGMDNADDGGFNTGQLWKLRNKLAPKSQEPPTAMKDSTGKLLTKDKDILNEAVKHYTEVFKEKPMIPEHETYKTAREKLCMDRLKECSRIK